MLPQSVVDLLPLPLSSPPGSQQRPLSTGVEALDVGLAGGGLPRGRLTEVMGLRGSGKVTLLRSIVEQTLRDAGWVAYIDATRTLAPRDWAHLGATEGLWMIRPRDPSRAAWCADVLLRCGAFALVVIDSAPVVSRGVAVRLTRLARESGAALIITGDEGSGSLVGGAVRLRVERAVGRGQKTMGRARRVEGGGHNALPTALHPLPSTHSPPPTRRMTIVVEKGGGGTHRTVEVSCAIGVARRLCTHPEVPDRRGVARRPAGGPGSERCAAPVAVPVAGQSDPNESAGERVLSRKRRCAEPEFGVGDLHAASHFRTFAECAVTTHWDDHPIVLTEPAGPKTPAGRRRLRSVSAAAGRAGIRAGMTIAEARAICAELQDFPWDDVAIAGAATEMTALLLEASPQVTPVAATPGMWWIGATGFGRGGERELAYALRRIAARWHSRPRVAIADSCVAARAATWAGTSFQQGDDRSLICIVPHGHDAGYLAPAPLALVPMPDELRLALQALGLRTVGSFAALSSEDVERRWGNEGLQAWRLARGDDARRPVLARVSDFPLVEAELAMPATAMEPILFLVRAALERLTTQLVSRGQAVAALSITLSLDDSRGALPTSALARAHTVTREVRLARPVARVAPLFERCRALLDGWTLTAPVTGVGVAIVAAAPLSGEQGDLLATTWRDAAAVDAALARLRAELGPNVVVKPIARDAHVPERRGAWVESVEGGALGVERESIATAPDTIATTRTASTTADPAIRLLESPESVFVVCDGGVPCAVTWRGRRLTIERAVGPERLSGDWWDDGYRRDYWRCESAFGDFVLYLDRMDDQWWVQGWFD